MKKVNNMFSHNFAVCAYFRNPTTNEAQAFSIFNFQLSIFNSKSEDEDYYLNNVRVHMHGRAGTIHI